jgi:drug/metabolite transporter (DMT)-like permease
VTRAYWPQLLLLAVAWGSSYLFIKLGIDGGLEPAPLICARLLASSLLLFLALAARVGLGIAAQTLAGAWRACVPIGVLSATIPMWLVAWGEKRIDSSVAGIAQATVPIFTALLALRFISGERSTPARWVGIAVGLLGVVVLTGIDTSGGWPVVVGTLAVVLSSLSYGGSNVFAQRSVRSIQGPVLATGAMLVGGVLLVPVALLQFPDGAPTGKAFGGLAALVLFGTVLAQLVYYRILEDHGASRTSLVAYLIPAVALALGVIFVDEPLRPAAVIGLVLILAGVAVGSGRVRHFLPGRRTT